MDYHFNPSRFFFFIPATWDRAAESRSESEQRAWAAHQNTPSLLLCSQDHQRAGEDRDRRPYERTSTWAHIYTVRLRLHLYVSASDVQTSARSVLWVCVFVCVCCIHYLGRQASYPGLTVWLDPARIPMKQWVSLRQPGSPCGPRAARGPRPRAPSPRSEPDAKRGGMESAEDSLRFEWTSNPFQLLWRWLRQNLTRSQVTVAVNCWGGLTQSFQNAAVFEYQKNK